MEEKNLTELDYYRIKTEYVKEGEKGELKRVKCEELVLAPTYAFAEQVAHKIADEMSRNEFGSVSIEIIKDKRIGDIAYNSILEHDEELVCNLVRNYFSESEDSGVGLYAVKVIFISTDEKGKEKRTTEVMYTPAESNSDATSRITKSIGNAIDYVIRDTKFDRAEAIYWPLDVYRSKTTETYPE